MTTRASILAVCFLAGCDATQSASPDAAILCASGQVVTAFGACVEQCANSCVTDLDCSGGLVCLATDGGCTECGAAPSIDGGTVDGGAIDGGDGGAIDGGAIDGGDAGVTDAGVGDGGLLDGSA